VARNLVNIEEVSKAFDIRALLERVSLGVSEGDRIGIVGRNGSGKSTLMKIIAAVETPDQGRVTKSNSVKIGLLSQVDKADPNSTVGDVVLGLESSGLHSNGYSLVRKIIADSKLDYNKTVQEFGNLSLGEALLEPTRLYTRILNTLLESNLGACVKAMSHITGGGIGANLARVLPKNTTLDIDRSSWKPLDVFQVLTQWGNLSLEQVESTWNLGLGFAVIVKADAAAQIQQHLIKFICFKPRRKHD
jgi:phosphoribosylaminoimidazole synthetase